MDIRFMLNPSSKCYENAHEPLRNPSIRRHAPYGNNNAAQETRSPSHEPAQHMTPAHVAYLNNGSARLRILSQDPFRSSVTMPGGEVFRLSSTRWISTSPLEKMLPGMTKRLLASLHNNSFSFERREGISTDINGICYLSQEHAVVLDLHPDRTGKFLLAAVTLPDMVFTHPTLFEHRPSQQCNLAIAEEALIHIRKYVYKPNFKSANKFSAKRDHGYETQRTSNAAKEIEMIRALPREERGGFSYTADGHNCTDLVYAAHFWISLKGWLAKPVYISDAHAILLVGDIPENLPSDMKEWPENFAVCDPWANICCPSKDYPEEFKKKMGKWEKDGKKITMDGENFISPTDPGWIRKVVESEKSIINLAINP